MLVLVLLLVQHAFRVPPLVLLVRAATSACMLDVGVGVGMLFAVAVYIGRG